MYDLVWLLRIVYDEQPGLSIYDTKAKKKQNCKKERAY